ncbi:hypothetical protein G9P44_003449 [Scheffersomyces stipitis]|nr:hypothetical protein G9P44_003449 [Scheffersomyces stipitis]
MSEIQHRLPPVQQPSVHSSAPAQTTASFQQQQQQGSKTVVKQEPVLNPINESQSQVSPPQTTTLPSISHLNKTQPSAQPQQQNQQSPQSAQQSPQQVQQSIQQPQTTQQIHPVQVINQVPPQHQAQLQHQLQNAPPLPQSGPLSQNPVHPNAKTTTHVNNGTTTTKTNITSPICRNCKTQTTPLWRRDETGQVLCNACGLFLKLHGRPRPISLKTDTIKSRNRIKQQNGNATGPGSNKSSSPNTPELKSKDSKSGKKSPKSKKPGKPNQSGNEGMGHNPALTPLLPASGAGAPSSGNAQGSPGFPHPINAYHHHHHHHHLPPHLQGHANGITSHQVVQPLHYPSSTPTQFAPGLQRITSPLLLSTSSSVSNTRTNSDNKMIAVHAAAGALENMSNELGPSATFKSNSASTSGNEGTTIAGVSLMNKHNSNIKRESPSTSSAIFSSALKTASSTPQQHPPKLPALGSSKLSSPSFNPQSSQSYSRSSTPNGSRIQSPETSHTSLPPIHQVASQSGDSKNQLPHIQHSFSNYNHLQQPSNQPHGEQPNGFPNSNNSNSNSNSNNNNNNNNHEVTLLKTRISELELVNDLYRTRIMELEAMEQAARLRESSMKKRLDEVLTLRNAPPAATETAQPVAASAAPSTAPQATTSEVPATTHQHSSVPTPQSNFTAPQAPAVPISQTSAPVQTQAPVHVPAAGITLPPATSLSSGINRFGDIQPIHHQQSATVLPAIRSLTEPTASASNSIVLPSLKRDNDDEYGSDPKKARY